MITFLSVLSSALSVTATGLTILILIRLGGRWAVGGWVFLAFILLLLAWEVLR